MPPVKRLLYQRYRITAAGQRQFRKAPPQAPVWGTSTRQRINCSLKHSTGCSKIFYHGSRENPTGFEVLCSYSYLHLIESAPTRHPAHQRYYCDITGLPVPYTDPKTWLRYKNKEVFFVIRTLTQGVVENFFEARGRSRHTEINFISCT